MPGVPPDAANIVKRVFKGIFKRGKKNKQDGADPTTATSPPPQQQPNLSAAPSQPQVDTKAPQLPPLANNSPLQGATESTNTLPPTHPLATGQHRTPQEAVPQNNDAQPPTAPPLGAGAPAVGAAGANDNLKEPEKLAAGNRDVSPPLSTSDAPDAPKSGAVSAISNEQPKTDGVAEGPALEDTKRGETTPAEPPKQTPAAPAAANAATSETPDPAPVAPKENVPPQTNGTSLTDKTSPAPTDAPTAPKSNADTADTKVAPSDEKIATVSEAPPINTARTAPGMSATSGPLEDFPEGGDAKD